ncbi:hypothetical protein GCM10022270_19460 [Terriglobus aquaticus]
MSGNELLARVRRAVHMADSLHIADHALAEEFLRATERCRESIRELQRVTEQLKTASPAAEAARLELLQQLSDLDCGDKLLHSMIDAGDGFQAEIHTEIPPGQLQ